MIPPHPNIFSERLEPGVFRNMIIRNILTLSDFIHKLFVEISDTHKWNAWNCQRHALFTLQD
jgi:hypothetical protein